MTHEISDLIEQAFLWQSLGRKVVMASVVSLEGSSYRRPGVRMLLNDAGEMKGAVSGGCVEKEVLRQAQTVFETGNAKVFSYDGRFRLGCEGIIHILIEAVFISESFLKSFKKQLSRRQTFHGKSFYSKTSGSSSMGTELWFDGASWPLHTKISEEKREHLECLEQLFSPLFRLFIFGAEHDAVQLSKAAKYLGWEVHIVASADEEKTLGYFEGAKKLHPLLSPDSFDTSQIDDHTAVMLMSHSFQKDLRYLKSLKDTTPAYLGALGPVRRREKLFDELLQQDPTIEPELIEAVYGPAGLQIGAESAAEIAISIIAEILSVVRKKEVQSLKLTSGKIHE